MFPSSFFQICILYKQHKIKYYLKIVCVFFHKYFFQHIGLFQIDSAFPAMRAS